MTTTNKGNKALKVRMDKEECFMLISLFLL